jgi:hypothetical protein
MTAIDKGSRRWTVAVHEAAHVVVARRLGWRVLHAAITGPVGREGGEMADAPPAGWGRRDRVRVAEDSAVISLAGTAASARQRWLLPSGCQHDQCDARRLLRETDLSYGEAYRAARHHIGKHWGEIERVACHLYRHGAL